MASRSVSSPDPAELGCGRTALSGASSVRFASRQVVLALTIALTGTLGASAGLAQDSGGNPKASSPESATIRLVGGDSVKGVIIHERPSLVRVKTAQGVLEFARDRIREIRREANPSRERFDDEYTAAFEDEDIPELWRLANWARGKGLMVASETALFTILELDPNHQLARSQLGHAKLEGEWIEADEVERLIAAGYRRRGLTLVPGPSGPVKPEPDTPEPATPEPADPKPERDAPGASPEKSGGAGDSAGSGGKAEKAGPSVGEYVDLEEWPKPRASAHGVVGDYRAEDWKSQISKDERFWKDFTAEVEEYTRARTAEHTTMPWSSAYDLKNPYYILRSNVQRKIAETYLWILEFLYEDLSRFMTGPKKFSARPTVRIYKSQEEFMEETRSPAGTGGFFRASGIGGIWAFYGVFDKTGTTFSVLVHEAVHHFQHQRTRIEHLPVWMTEGLAVYYGDGSVLDPKKRKVVTGLVPRDRLLHLLDKHKNDRHQSLRDLARLRRLGGSEYADAWSLVYYMFNGPEKARGRAVFIELWQRSLERRVSFADFEEVVVAGFGSLEALEEKWFAFTKSLKPEPAGKTRGDRFDSYNYRVEILRPDDRWRWNHDSRALIEAEIPDTGVRYSLELLNRPIRTALVDKEALEQKFLRLRFEDGLRTYDPEFSETDFHGHPVTLVRYERPIKAIQDAFLKAYAEKHPVPEGRKEREEWAETREDLLRALPREIGIEFVVRVHNRAYYVVGVAPPEEFDAMLPWFEAMAKTMRPVLEPRW